MVRVVEPVTLSVGDVQSITQAMATAGVSGETIRRWCVGYGIGRQWGAGKPWRVSGPALRMILACDHDALEAFRRREFHLPFVAIYLNAASLPA
jgi:hypothetical protein